MKTTIIALVVSSCALSCLAAAATHRSWITQLDEVVPALTRVLSDPDPRARGIAPTSQRNLGPKAKAAAPELQKLLQDPNAYPGERAAEMLMKIVPEAAVKAGVK